MKRNVIAAFLVMLLVGCTSTPQQASVQLRALFKEVQTKQAEICSRPNHSEVKCAEVKKRIDEIAPWVDKIEILAAELPEKPMNQIELQVLYATYKPAVEKLVIDMALLYFLGV